MTSAPSPASPLVSASLHEDDTLLRIVLDWPKASVLTLERRKPVWEDR